MSKSAFGMSSSLMMMMIGMIYAKNLEQQTINMFTVGMDSNSGTYDVD